MSKTGFLEPLEDLAYRRMLDLCYLTEKPLPESIDEIAMLIRMRSHCDSIAVVLRYFFELTADGYINDMAVRVIAEYQGKSSKAKASADARWEKERAKKLNESKGLCDCDANALRTECEGNANHKPITNNHKPITNKKTKSIDDDLIDQVFTYWQKVFNKNRTKLDAKRKSKIKARLADGRTLIEIQTAIDNCSKSEFHTTNGHIDIELICRDDSKFESFLSRSNKPIQPQNNNHNGYIDFSTIGNKPETEILVHGVHDEPSNDYPF